jgi:hypothetical protein
MIVNDENDVLARFPTGIYVAPIERLSTFRIFIPRPA